MTNTTAIMIPEASALTVDTSCIDCSEVESQQDKDFLQEIGEDILRIAAKAALQVGEKLVRVQDKLGDRSGKLEKFYTSIGVKTNQASRWACKYRAFIAYKELFGEDDSVEKFTALPDGASNKLWNLPTEYREAFLADIAQGNIPTENEVAEVSRRSEVKLSKAKELLAAAAKRKEKADEKWELVKADPDIKKGDSNYQKADKATTNSQTSIDRFTQQIADLQAQIEEEKENTEKEIEAREKADKATAKAMDKLKSEVDRLNTPAEAQKQRMLATSNALYAQLPNVHGHLVTFYGDIEAYDSDTIRRIEEQIKLLHSLIEAHL